MARPSIMRMPRNRLLPGTQPLTSTATRFLSSKPTVSTSEGETSATPSIFCRAVAHLDIEAARELVGAAGADDHQVDPLGLIDRHERLLEVPGDADQDDDGRNGDRQPDRGQDRADRAMNDVLGDQGDEPHESVLARSEGVNQPGAWPTRTYPTPCQTFSNLKSPNTLPAIAWTSRCGGAPPCR